MPRTDNFQEHALRSRVNDLEEEVRRLKKRLDELRKAKNQTYIKRETDVIKVGLPFSERRSSKDNSATDHAICKKELEDLKRSSSKQIEELQKKIESLSSKKETEAEEPCQHENEIKKLLFRISELESNTASLEASNVAYQSRIDELMLELSLKEAKWCEKEEQYTAEIKKLKSPEWQEKYAKWMESMQNRVETLQDTQTFLRSHIRGERRELEQPTAGLEENAL